MMTMENRALGSLTSFSSCVFKKMENVSKQEKKDRERENSGNIRSAGKRDFGESEIV